MTELTQSILPENSPDQELDFTPESLKHDTFVPIPVPNFSGQTGKDLRGNPEKQKAEQLRIGLEQAESDIRSVLGIRPEARFSQHTGRSLPELAINRAGRLEGTPTPEQLASRVRAYKEDIRVLVQQAEAKGVAIPRFDGQTGEEIPEDSLRALLASGFRTLTLNGPVTEADGDRADLDLAERALMMQLRVKAEELRLKNQGGNS